MEFFELMEIYCSMFMALSPLKFNKENEVISEGGGGWKCWRYGSERSLTTSKFLLIQFECQFHSFLWFFNSICLWTYTPCTCNKTTSIVFIELVATHRISHTRKFVFIELKHFFCIIENAFGNGNAVRVWKLSFFAINMNELIAFVRF